MAASKGKRTFHNIGFVLSVLTFFTIYSGIICDTTEDAKGFEDNYQFQSLFRTLLTELHGYETNIHRCIFLANNTQNFQCIISPVDRQTHFLFPSVSSALESSCATEDVYSCMQSNSFVKRILGTIEEDISKTVEDVCCFLAQCQGCETAMVHSEPLASNGQCNEGCINCSKHLGKNDTQSFRRIGILRNVTCVNKTFNNFPCKELNIIALNVLSTLASSKLLEDAKDMIKQCNPGFFEDPARTLSAMITPPTDVELANVEYFFTSSAVGTKATHTLQPKIKARPGKVIGIIFLVVIVIASLFTMGWLIRTRVFNNRSMPINFSNVLYSRIDYDHENLDDYSDDDDEDKGELSMFERA